MSGASVSTTVKYSLAECAELIDFLQNDPHYGGNFVIVGSPCGWRTLDRDAVPDPKLTEVLQKADMINPWTPGRYATSEQAIQHAERYWRPDIAWCREHHLEYAPTVFPGFSWHNTFANSPSPLIPALQGAIPLGRSSVPPGRPAPKRPTSPCSTK